MKTYNYIIPYDNDFNFHKNVLYKGEVWLHPSQGLVLKVIDENKEEQYISLINSEYKVILNANTSFIEDSFDLAEQAQNISILCNNENEVLKSMSLLENNSELTINSVDTPPIFETTYPHLVYFDRHHLYRVNWTPTVNFGNNHTIIKYKDLENMLLEREEN